MGFSLNDPSGWSWESGDRARASRYQAFGSKFHSLKTDSVSVAGFARVLAPIRAGIAPSLSAREIAELDSISAERNPEIFWNNLLGFGVRLEASGKAELAANLYAGLLQQNFPGAALAMPETSARQIEQRLAALRGGGSFGARFETLGSQFVRQTANLKLIVPVLAGSVAGEVLGKLAIGGHSATNASHLLGTLRSRYAAKALGYATEVTVFAGVTRYLSPSDEAFSRDLARASLTLGAFRLFGWGGKQIQGAAAGTLGLNWASKTAAPAATLLGLMASEKLQQRIGLVAAHETSNLLLDSAFSYLTLSAGNYLGRRLLGNRYLAFQDEIAARAGSRKNTAFDFTFEGYAPAFVGPGGASPSRINLFSKALPPNGAIWMSGTKNNGNGKIFDDEAFESTEVAALKPRSETIVPSNPNIKHRPPTLPSESKIQVADPAIGQVIDGRYRIDDILGQGGMGVVYSATHQVIGNKLAIKFLWEKYWGNQDAVERFINEAKHASAVGNPHITTIADAGYLPNGAPYIVMEYLKGMPLSQLIDANHELPEARIIAISRQIAEGLSAVHKAGIVHRDLKPDNIFLTSQGNKSDFVKILDFGIAKMLNSNGKKLTSDGTVFGTPQYMSPEQTQGKALDQRSDVYALGVIMYELVAREVPFHDPDRVANMVLHITTPPKPFSELEPAITPPISPQLEAIIFKALAKRESDRYQSMDEVIADLDQLSKPPQAPALAVLQNAKPELAPVIVDIVANQAQRPPPRPNRTPTFITGPISAQRRWPVVTIVGLAGVAALLAALLALKKQNASDEAVPSDANGSTPPDAAPAPPVDAAPDTQAVVTPIISKVTILVEPKDAHVYQNGVDLGTGKVSLEIVDGESQEVEIRRKGFKTKKFTINGQKDRETLKLERERVIRNGNNSHVVRPPNGSGSNGSNDANKFEFEDPLKKKKKNPK